MALPKLTERQEDACRRLIRACDETGEYLEACKACQLDVQEEIDRNNEQRNIAKEIAKRFGVNMS